MSFVVTVAAAFEVGATFATIATAVSYVGVAMTVVGTVTKSKELTGLGKVLSIGGGIASLGAAAGAWGTASGEAAGSSVFSEAASNVVPDAAVNQAADAAAQTTADSFAGAASASSNNVVGSTLDAVNGVAGDSAASGASSLASDYATPFNPNDAAGAGFSAPTPIAPDASAAAPTADVAKPAGLVNQATAPSVTGSASAIPDAQNIVPDVPKPGIGQSIRDWYSSLKPDQQSRIASGALQLGGNAIGGLFQGWTAEQQLDLQKEIQAQKTDQYNTSVANANSIPTIQFKPRGLVNSTKGG